MALNLKTETVLSGEAPAAQPPLPPRDIAPHFPQLEILECLGRGGMGVVYKARQKSLNRFVALKLLAPERINNPEFAGRFAREAQALAALNHPNIVTIYDFGQAGGFYFLLMEFVDGVNLRHLLRARKFTPEEALVIVPPLCDALQFAHERGIVHRDIKPENILLDKSGRVKVADFGIAKMLGNGAAAGGGETNAPANATRQAVGTPGYIAPEQAAHPQRVDSRADIYSLGVVFYEMLTGELPGKRIEPPSRKVQIDVRLDEIVLRALEQKPELRYQQASVLKTQVETIAQTPAGGGAGPFTNQDYTAPWSQGLVALSVFCTVACGWPAFMLFRAGDLAAVMIGTSLLAIIFACALFVIRGYTLTAEALLIRRPFWITRLPLAGLQSARMQPGILQWGIRYGNGGFYSFTGWRYNRALGLHRVFVNDQSRTVVLRYPGRTVVVSPGDPEAFARDLNAVIKRLPARKPVPGDMGQTIASAPAFYDRPPLDKWLWTAAIVIGTAVLLALFKNGTGGRRPVFPSLATVRDLNAVRNLAGGNPASQSTNSLAQSAPALAASNHQPLGLQTEHASATFSEPPTLRFLAWEDEWQTNQPGAARHPDGSLVTKATELNWLKELRIADCGQLKPGLRFLHIWVSHPAFTANDSSELLDAHGNSFPIGSLYYGFDAADGQVEGKLYANLPFHCWKCWAFCPGDTTNLPSRITLRLRYTIGPMERTWEVTGPNFLGTGTMLFLPLEDGSQLTGVGQNAQGRAFVSIVTNDRYTQTHAFDVLAVSKDGRETASNLRTGPSHSTGTDVAVENFSFELPLTDVARFIIGTRTIRTTEWKDVVLPGIVPADEARSAAAPIH
jgi:tRNA A-37 threonylcarbamoyl transferase component Bud32